MKLISVERICTECIEEEGKIVPIFDVENMTTHVHKEREDKR